MYRYEWWGNIFLVFSSLRGKRHKYRTIPLTFGKKSASNKNKLTIHVTLKFTVLTKYTSLSTTASEYPQNPNIDLLWIGYDLTSQSKYIFRLCVLLKDLGIEPRTSRSGVPSSTPSFPSSCRVGIWAPAHWDLKK